MKHESSWFTVEAHYKRLKDLIEEKLPNSRERSLALTNIEQGMLWANLALEQVEAEGDRVE
jgi:hypothetical protein